MALAHTYTAVEKHRNKIFTSFYDVHGQKHYKLMDYQPTLYTETDQPSKFKSLGGKNLEEKRFANVRDFFDFKYKNQETLDLYGDISPTYQFIQRHFGTQYDLSMIRVGIIDIEVKSEEGFPHPDIAMWPITSISLKDVSTNKVYVAALKGYDKNLTILDGVKPENINFRMFKDDRGILKWLCQVLKYTKPDILCGWNSDNFDFPYIINRFDYVFDDEMEKLKLSPTNVVYSELQQNQRDFRNVIGGITLFDYMRLYKKYVFKPRASYALDFISSAELGATKIDYSEFDDLNDLWDKNPQKYIDYNIYDVELIDMLEKKLGLIDLACTVAYKARCNFIDVMGTIRVWDVLLYNYLREQNIMIPPNKDVEESQSFTGAYVKDPKTAIYDWVVSLDLASLYPHLQQQFNISPECLVKNESIPVSLDHVSNRLLNREIKGNKDYILAANGHYFRKDKEGFIPTILREIYSERSAVKKTMLEKKQELILLKEEKARRDQK